MPVLQLTDVSFGYGASPLFQHVTFRVHAGERVALVAPNGAGKTTLLRVIAGELTPDQGQVIIDKGARLGLYRQSHELSAEGTVLDVLLSGFREVLELRRQVEQAREQAADGSKESLRTLAALEERLQAADGDEVERRVDMLAHSLGFSADALQRPVSSLSGGERGRLHLGAVLVHQPELLLLDEPTNHLDLPTIRWLEGYLREYRGAVVVVSHDRAFLDNVCPRTLELGVKALRDYPLPYTRYVQQRDEEIERERALVERKKAQIAKTEEFIRKNLAGQKTKQAQSRRRMLERMEVPEEPEDVWAAARRLGLRFAPAPRSGDIVLEAHGLGASRGGRTLFSGLDLLLRRGERLAIVGPNGCGKTTLLRLLAGFGEDGDQGQVRRGSNLMDGYFDQHLGSLDEQKDAIEEIRSVRGDMNVDTTRQYLARFRFWGDQPFQKVGNMSGGERSRLALAKLLLEPRNLLFLDEPTNHLDIPASELLEDALMHFEGTVVFVSHDRRFLENVSTRVLVFEQGKVDMFPGSYREWVEQQQGKGDSSVVQQPESTQTHSRQARRQDRNREISSGRAAFEASKAAARARQRKQRRFEQLEKLIAEAEEQIESLKEKALTVPGDDWQKLSELNDEQQRLEEQVQQWLEEWSTLGEELEGQA